MHVLIAGAGIGGLTAALALARIGANVTLLERAPSLDEVGAGLQISPNASRILCDLGLFEAVAAQALRPTGVRIRAAKSGRTLSYLPLGDAHRRWGSPYLILHRADLQQVLTSAVMAEPAIDLYLGTSLAGFGTTGAGVTVMAKQGFISRSFEADALIGADGIHSAVRSRLVEAVADRPTETGRMAWRALVDPAAVTPMFAAPETTLWLGRDAHLVHYPLRGCRQINLVAITRESSPADPSNLWAKPGDAAKLGARFAGWHASVRDLIAAAPTWTTWPLFDRAPLPAWNAGPIALLGDAAHPILPFMAQGAAQAIEDAAALAAAIRKIGNLPEALAAYSRARLARATRVQATSREQGRIYHLAGPAAVARNAAMRLAGPGRLLARYDWLYGATVPET